MKATPTLEKFNKQLPAIQRPSSCNEERLESCKLREENQPGVDAEHFSEVVFPSGT